MVPESLIDEIERYCRAYLAGIHPRGYDFRRIAREFVDESRAIEQIRMLHQVTGSGLRGKRVLEIGSGFGMFVATARTVEGCEAWGVEPSDEFRGTYQVGKKLLGWAGLPQSCILRGYGESLPLRSSTFDIVCSSNVLEHVADPLSVLRESVRVLKPGGWLVFVVPNYGSWWEGHYGMVVPPLPSRGLLKLAAWTLGRDPAFVDTLQLVTYGRLRVWLKSLPFRIKVHGYGQDVWEHRMRTLQFSAWADLGVLKRVLGMVRSLRMVEPIIWAGRRLHWETPFILSLTKEPS